MKIFVRILLKEKSLVLFAIINILESQIQLDSAKFSQIF